MSEEIRRLAVLASLLALTGCLSFSTECKVFPGSDGGACDAGTGGGDAGNVVRLDAGTFQITQIFPDTTGAQGVYDHITGLSEQDIWVSDSKGVIRHFDGASWRPMFAFDAGVPADSVVRGLHENTNKWILASTLRTLISCPGPCTDGGSFRVDDWGIDYVFTGLCAQSDFVCAPGIWSNDGGVSGEALLTVTCALGNSSWYQYFGVDKFNEVVPLGDCGVATNDRVLFALNHGVGLFQTDDGGYSREDAGFGGLLPPRSNWTRVGPMGDSMVATGIGKKVSVRDAAGNWTQIASSPGGEPSGEWRDIGSTRPDEAFLVGTSGPAWSLARLSGGVLYLLPDLHDFELDGVWPESDTVWYFVGKDTNGQGVAFRAVRK